jgi:hypothetical protein
MITRGVRFESSTIYLELVISEFLYQNAEGIVSKLTLQVLFPYEDLVKFFQYEVRGISPRGLFNCGNSCYANAVLQCLMCTKPLMIYLLLRLHSKDCCSKNWCLMCELEQYASTLRESGGPVSPSRILSNLRNIGCRLGGGSQEDAHEFLRCCNCYMLLLVFICDCLLPFLGCSSDKITSVEVGVMLRKPCQNFYSTLLLHHYQNLLKYFLM